MTVMRSKAVKDYFQRRGGASATLRGELRKQECATPDLRSPQQIAISQGMKFHWQKRKASKYKNVPTVVGGVRFASKAEAKRDAELLLLHRAGKISHIIRQPRFPLVVNGKKVCTYVGDWRYFEILDGEKHEVVEDRKGVLTDAFKIKWALAKALYPRIEFRLS